MQVPEKAGAESEIVPHALRESFMASLNLSWRGAVLRLMRPAALRSLIAGLGALCVLLCSAAAGPTVRYTDAESRFSFQPPEGWQRRPDLPRPVVAFIGPEEEGFAVNFVVNIHNKPVEEAELDKFVQQIKIENGEIYAQTKTTLNGKPARAWRTHMHVPGHPLLENRQIVCIFNKRAYELTFTMPPVAVKKYDPVFEKIVASFRWEKEPPKVAPGRRKG